MGLTAFHITSLCGGKHDKDFLIPPEFIHDLRKENKYNTWSVLVEKGQNALNGGISPPGVC
jgi:hypothetical protein